MEKRIKIYTISTCSHCKATKKLLADCAVGFDSIDVDLLEKEERKEILHEIRRLNPQCSFPTLVIGEKVIVGFKEDAIRKVLGL